MRHYQQRTHPSKLDRDTRGSEEEESGEGDPVIDDLAEHGPADGSPRWSHSQGRRSSGTCEEIDVPELPLMPTSGVLIGMDSGGTLTKICIHLEGDTKMAANLEKFIKHSNRYGKTGQRDQKYDFETSLGGRVFFLKYETHRSEGAIKIMKDKKLLGPGAAIGCTGGGAFKFNRAFQKALGVGWSEVDEMEALVSGITFLIQQVPNSIYYLSEKKEEDRVFKKNHLPAGAVTHPCLLVNIGSGVSVLLMEGPRRYRRVGGSSLGGATFYGLARLLSACETFQEALDLAAKGDSTKVDLLVGDIYGGHYTKLGLRADMIAAYFGKMTHGGLERATETTPAPFEAPAAEQDGSWEGDKNRQNKTENKSNSKKTRPSKADLVAALLKLITYSVGSTAWLYARVYKPKNLIFTGNFLRNNKSAKHRINYMIHTLSKGRIRALFMEREGYYGALGAMLRGRKVDARPSIVAFDPASGKETEPESRK